MIKVPFESARTVHGGLSSIITVSTRWMYPFVHSMFGRTILPWTEINGVSWLSVYMLPHHRICFKQRKYQRRLYKCHRPWSWQQAPRTHTTLCKRQTQSLQLLWRSNLLPKKKCVTFLQQVLQLWSFCSNLWVGVNELFENYLIFWWNCCWNLCSNLVWVFCRNSSSICCDVSVVFYAEMPRSKWSSIS